MDINRGFKLNKIFVFFLFLECAFGSSSGRAGYLLSYINSSSVVDLVKGFSCTEKKNLRLRDLNREYSIGFEVSTSRYGLKFGEQWFHPGDSAFPGQCRLELYTYLKDKESGFIWFKTRIPPDEKKPKTSENWALLLGEKNRVSSILEFDENGSKIRFIHTDFDISNKILIPMYRNYFIFRHKDEIFFLHDRSNLKNNWKVSVGERCVTFFRVDPAFEVFSVGESGFVECGSAGLLPPVNMIPKKATSLDIN